MYRHGIYVSEQETSMIAPLNGTAGLQVVIGTAPVHLLADPAAAINKPLLVYSKAEAIAAVGYSDDFASFTLCEAISASFAVVNVAPLVLINVLDPAKHSAEMEEKTVQINSGVAVVEETGVLLSTLVVKNGEETLTAEEDYTAVYNADGTVSIVLIEGGKADGATNLTVSGKKVDASKVTAADIVGGVDAATGAETGLEVVRQVYPKLGMTPGILTAPRFSANAAVSAALQAKTKEINGVFKCVCIADVDSGAQVRGREGAEGAPGFDRPERLRRVGLRQGGRRDVQRLRPGLCPDRLHRRGQRRHPQQPRQQDHRHQRYVPCRRHRGPAGPAAGQ